MNQPALLALTARLGAVNLRQQVGGAWRLAHRWKRRVLFAFIDQGVYSTTNFLLTSLYAAWLPLDDFGRYVVIWTVALFIEAIQTSRGLIRCRRPAGRDGQSAAGAVARR